MTSNDSSPTDEIAELGVDFDISNNTIVNLTYYITSLILGLTGNAIILQTYAWKKRKTSTDYLIMGQAVIDFVACSFSLPFIIRSGFPELIKIGLCRFVFYAEEIFALNSLLLTTLISIDRYLAVCHPLRRRMTVGFPFIPSSIIHGKIHILTLLSTFYNLRLTNHIANFYVYYCVNSSFRRDVKGSFAKYPHCK
eukprot:XP_011669633.1 PREDICTED: prolactin-releasing peptide receptor-like [Strongylocentrotus purpuratus]